MKVEVNTAALADATEWASHVIPDRPPHPVLTGIKIHAETGLMQLSTFNYEQSARCQIDAGVDEEDTIVVPGKLLARIAKVLPAETAYLSTEDSRLNISSGNTVFNLQLMNETDYPELPAVPSMLGKIDGHTFRTAVEQVIIAASHDETRTVLTGIRMIFKGDQVTFSATDRFRLTRSTFDWTPEDPSIDITAIVKAQVLKDIANSIDPAQSVVIGFNENNDNLLSFSNAGRVKTSVIISGTFPNVDRLFADSYPMHTVLSRNELIEALNRVTLVAERDAPIRMEFTGDDVRLSAGTVDESQASEIIPADFDGEPITVAFNPKYLLDGLKAIPDPFVRMKMTTALKAVEFNGQREKDDEPLLGYRYLLVPMRYIG